MIPPKEQACVHQNFIATTETYIRVTLINHFNTLGTPELS